MEVDPLRRLWLLASLVAVNLILELVHEVLLVCGLHRPRTVVHHHCLDLKILVLWVVLLIARGEHLDVTVSLATQRLSVLNHGLQLVHHQLFFAQY